MIRDVGTIYYERVTGMPFVQHGAVGFIGFAESDGRYQGPTEAIVALNIKA